MGPVDDVTAIAGMLRGRRTLVVTGAGISTDAGVPDYRGSGAPERATVEYGDFVLFELWQRYLWWRNELSWRTLDAAQPTAGHHALARLEHAGLVAGVATQNVDRLHARAGSQVVAELHGRFDTVVCLHCGARFTRAHVSELIRAANPGLAFPAVTLDRIAQALAGACDVVLAVGTSLVVSTGMWVVMQAVEAGARLVVVNRGPTQADRIADLRVEGGASEVLAGVATALLGGTQ